MTDSSTPQRLSQIQTLWTVVRQACGAGPTQIVNTAQQQMLERYGKVVHRYLLGALRDPDAADEISQEFALRFVQGDLRGADRERGRFRDFLKGVLFHLICDFHRRRGKDPHPLPVALDPTVSAHNASIADGQFLESWRSELLDSAWKALSRHEDDSGQPFHTVLRFRAEHPELRSEAVAEQLGVQLARPLTAASVRQTLHRAREKFAELLVEEVLHTLDHPTIEEIEQELIDLTLHEYCGPALDRLRHASGTQPS
jgi:RNA polymerase sigma-70 factor (ECF subfamily)